LPECDLEHKANTHRAARSLGLVKHCLYLPDSDTNEKIEHNRAHDCQKHCVDDKVQVEIRSQIEGEDEANEQDEKNRKELCRVHECALEGDHVDADAGHFFDVQRE